MAMTEAREVVVAELPEGYAKERFTSMVIDPSVATVVVAAKRGVIGDWAVYIGWPPLHFLKTEMCTDDVIYYATTVTTPEDVLRVGDKLPAKEARALFPDWLGNYRG